MLVVGVGARRYALPVGTVLAVRDGAGPRVEYRGGEIPVLDAGEVGLGERTGGPGGAIVVLGGAGEPRAVRVDAVEGIVAGAEVRGWPPLLAPVVGPGFPGVVAAGEGELVVFDARVLFRDRDPAGGRSPHEEAGETS